jgi:hypothetical protein
MKCMLIEASISHPKTMKVQSQCARVMLSGESVLIDRSFGSSGLHLACEGLLLGGVERRPQRNPLEAPPRAV